MKKFTHQDVHSRARTSLKKRMKEDGVTTPTKKHMSYFRSMMNYWKERLLEL